jgi:hypothetical protein
MTKTAGTFAADPCGFPPGVQAPRPPHNHMMRYVHRQNRIKSPPPPTNPPLLRPPYAPRPPFRLAHSPPYNTGVVDEVNAVNQKRDPLNPEGQNMDAGSYDVHDGGADLGFLARCRPRRPPKPLSQVPWDDAPRVVPPPGLWECVGRLRCAEVNTNANRRKHHAPELMGMLAMAVVLAGAMGVTMSHARRRRRAAENEAMSRPIVYGRPTYGAFDNSQKDYLPEEATTLLA